MWMSAGFLYVRVEASFAGSNGVVEPNSRHRDPPLAGSPESFATGASTAGVRTPPRAFPCSSTTKLARGRFALQSRLGDHSLPKQQGCAFRPLSNCQNY